jgi:hypothetical protein
MNDVWKSIDGGFTWTEVTDNTGWRSDLHGESGVALPIGNNGIILAMGGKWDSAGTFTNEVWRSPNGGVTWACITTGSEFTKITEDDVQIPDEWFPIDMVLSTNYTAGNVGKLYIYISDNRTGVFSTSSAIMMYTVPSTDSVDGGIWTDVTPSQFLTESVEPPSASVFSHTGLAVVTTRDGEDSVFCKYMNDDDDTVHTLRHVSGTTWETTGIAPVRAASHETLDAVFRSSTSGNIFCGMYNRMPV